MSLFPNLSKFLPLICLLLLVVLWVALESYLLGIIPAIGFVFFVSKENPTRRLSYLALSSSVIVLTLAPINTDLSNIHFLTLSTCFILAIVLPTFILRSKGIITFNFFPKHINKIDKIDIFYTLLSIPLAWGAFMLYFLVLSPDVPFNWTQPSKPEGEQLFRLFIGINGVGVWDELFFINVSYAIIRKLFRFWPANFAQAVVYTSILWDMAFRGFGLFFVYAFAITQGAMYERSKVLLWVLIVHLIVDYFLFQAIVSAHYPEFKVWWH